MTSRSRGSVSMPGTCIFRLSTGIAITIRASAATPPAIQGRRRTRSRIAPQNRDSCAARFSGGVRNGIRPRFTRSPSFESTAGSTVSEPKTAIATTRIVPVANDSNVEAPARYMPAIAVATVMPETSTARPEVAAAALSAASELRPRARSSRSRRR